MPVVVVAAPAGACRVEQRAEAPAKLVEGFALMPASLGNRAVTMVLDTGAQEHLVTPGATAALGLAPDPARRSQLFGTGGQVIVGNVVLPQLGVGGLIRPPRSVPVAPLPGLPATDPPIAGLLGAPLWAGYDLELDLPHGRMAVHAVRDCPDGPRPFAPPYVMLPMRLGPEGQPVVTVSVNGVALEAVLDTGSRATLVTERAAARVGLGAALLVGTTRGVDGSAVPVRQYATRELRVGWEALPGVVVSVARIDISGADMLLGTDYLGARRVWVSYASGRVFIQASSER